MLNTHSYDKCMQQGYSESLYSGLCCFSFVHFSLKSTQLLEVLTQWMIYVIWANLDLPIFGTLDTRVFYCTIPINSSILTTNSAYPNPSTPSDLSRTYVSFGLFFLQLSSCFFKVWYLRVLPDSSFFIVFYFLSIHI